MMEVLDTMKNITTVDSVITKIVKGNGVAQCIHIFEAAGDNLEVLVKTVDMLDKLCYHNKEALEICAKRITPLVYSSSLKHKAS